MANTYMPINLSLENRKCLVVGGGKVALRKIENLMNYTADITVISPEVDKKIEYFAERERITLHRREYQSPDAQSFGLVISATNNDKVNEIVYNDCQKSQIPVNVVDNPKLCDVIFPALIKRDCLSIAVSTDGKAPYLSGHLRMILEDIFQERWTKIAKYAVEFRDIAFERWSNDPIKKARSLENFLEADWQDLLKKEKNKEIDIKDEFEKFMNMEDEKGNDGNMVMEFGPSDANEEDTVSK